MNENLKEPVGQKELEAFRQAMSKLMQCCQEQTGYRCERFLLNDAEQRLLLHFGDERYFTAKGLARKLNVAKSRITKIVSGLAAKGLLTRAPDPADSRYHLLSLTPEGRRRRDELESFLQGLHAEILARLEPMERKELVSALERLRLTMEAIRDKLD